MADSATYLIKSAVFTPAGGSPSAATIDGIEEVTIRQGGQVVAHGSDAQFTVTSHFTDRDEAEVSIRTRNAVWKINTALKSGIVGTLAITMQKRFKGKGAVAGEDKIMTFVQAMVGERNLTLPDTDRSDLGITFHCSDPDGADVVDFS